MVNKENQIDVMLEIDSNIDTVTKHVKDLDNQISIMQKNIAKANSNGINQQKSQINAAEQKIKMLQAELSLETNKLTQLSKIKQQAFAQELQSDYKLHGSKVKNLNQLATDSKKFEEDSIKFKQWGANFNKQIQQDEITLHKKTVQEKIKGLKEEERQRAKSWKGALPNSGYSTTFGHKFVTTAQYAAAGVGIATVAGAIFNLGQAALESELNMRTMAAVLDLNIPKAMELDASVRKLGETYGGVATDIEQVALALGRAGVKTKDIVAATEVTLAMARLTGDTFEQSTSAIISYQQVFGNTTSIETLGDKLAYVANVSRLSTQDIGTFSNYALAAAKDVGLTEDAVGGLAAAFSNAGVNASTIGTQIRRFTTLLTDDSAAVTGFFRNIGVNQANLLADLQKGGKASNEALLGFVKMLHSVDKSEFTNLTGQMDILAANSLQLMRNNSSNIDKFVRDLQTGMEGQLDSTAKILDSYLVTFQSMWNSLANISAKGLQGLSNDLTQVSRIFDIMTGDRERAALKGLKIAQDEDDANILRYRKMRELGEKDNKGRIVDAKVLAEYEEYFAKKRIERDVKVKQLLGKPIKVDTTETIKSYDAILEAQQKVIDGFGKDSSIDDKALESALAIQKEYLALKKDLVTTTETETTKQGNLSNIQRASLNEQISLIRALKDSGADVAEQEKQMYSYVEANKTGRVTQIKNQITALDKYTDAHERVKALVTDSTMNDPLKLEATINKRLDELKSLDSKLITESLVREANSLNEIKKINKDSLSDVQGILNYRNQIAKASETESRQLAKSEEAKRKAEETAQRRAEAKVQLEEKIASAQTASKEIFDQILDSEKDSLSNAESKFRVNTELLALAYEQYRLSVGTGLEDKNRLEYEQALTAYAKTSLTFITKAKEEEITRVNLMADYKDSLDSSIAAQEYRLGLVKDERLNEIEKLKLKVQQDLLSGKINQNDADALNKQIALLETLSRKKKDIYTFTAEYQRQIDDQETAGYNAMKAGITTLESGMMDFFDVTSEGWADWHKLASSVLSSVYKQLLEQLVVKQLVSGITGGIGSMFTAAASSGSWTTNNPSVASGAIKYNNGGMIPTKGYATGGVLSGGTGIRDDIYLGNVDGTQMFAMGGEFITRKSSVNEGTKGTLDYINKTGTTPNQGSQVNVPVKINIENQTGQAISADMIQQMTQTNDKGDYEKVVNIVLKASMTDPRMRSLLKGGR